MAENEWLAARQRDGHAMSTHGPVLLARSLAAWACMLHSQMHTGGQTPGGVFTTEGRLKFRDLAYSVKSRGSISRKENNYTTLHRLYLTVA